jgi:hypothetical protein
VEARRTVGEMRGLSDTAKKTREDDPRDEPRSRSFYTPSLARVALVGASAGVAELYFFGLSPVLALAAAAAGAGFFVVFALFAGYIESETAVSAIAGGAAGAVWWIIVHPPDVSSLLAMAVGAVLGVIYMWRGE